MQERDDVDAEVEFGSLKLYCSNMIRHSVTLRAYSSPIAPKFRILFSMKTSFLYYYYCRTCTTVGLLLEINNTVRVVITSKF